MMFRHSLLIRIHDVEGAKAHLKKHGYVLIKHRNEIILMTHGTPEGDISTLDRVRKLGLKFTRIACCFPRACKEKNPELSFIGNVNMPTGFNYTSEGVELYIA